MMTTLNNRVSALFADPLQTLLGELNLPTPGQGSRHSLRSIAPLSIWDEGDSVCMEIDVPGLTKEDLEITLRKGCLTIKGQRKACNPSTDFYFQERRFGEFERAVVLDDSVDPSRIDAELRDGVLLVKFAKKRESQPQRILINCSSSDDTKCLDKPAA